MINVIIDLGLFNFDYMMKYTYVYKEEKLSFMICFLDQIVFVKG